MAERKNSEARIRANNKYNAKAYDRINIAIPKGQKETVQAHAAACGESVNGFIGRAIKEAIARDGAETPADASEQPAAVPISPTQKNAAQPVSAPATAIPDIPPKKLEQARAHAEARREPVSSFLIRAIDETMERDNAAPVASQGDSEGAKK